MLTDDPDTPGPGRWEINLAYTGERTAVERNTELPLLDLNYGVGPSIQLKYETAWLVNSDEAGRQGGIGNSLIGLKWRFWDGGESATRISVYPQYEFENSEQSVRRGIADPGPNLLLPVQISHPFGPLQLVGEAGYEFVHEANDILIYGLLVSVEISEQSDLLAEVHGNRSRDGGSESVINLGMRRSLTDRVRLLASAGTGLGDGPERVRLLAYLGIQLLLGKDES